MYCYNHLRDSLNSVLFNSSNSKVDVECTTVLLLVAMTEGSEYIVRIIDKKSLKGIEGDSQVDVFVDVIETLVQNYNLENKVSIPYGPGSKRAILNSLPENLDGSEMRSSRELSSGLYVNTNLNREEKLRYILRFASMCEVDVQYSGWK